MPKQSRPPPDDPDSGGGVAMAHCRNPACKKYAACKHINGAWYCVRRCWAKQVRRTR